MAIKSNEVDFTEQDWLELGKELEKWAARGCYERISTKRSKEPVALYLEVMHGISATKSYVDVDFKENKLAYHTISWILRRKEKCRLGLDDNEILILMGGYNKYLNKALLCPCCDINKITKIKKANDPSLRKLEKLCGKYLKGIGVL